MGSCNFSKSLKTYIKVKKTPLRLVLIVLLFCGLCSFIFAQTSTSENINKTESTQKTLRVGYMDYNGFITLQKDGSYIGYGVEYLNEVAKYTGFKYEYVFSDWSVLLEKLYNKEIDLLCTAQYTPERGKKYDFSAYPIGYTQGLLYTSMNNQDLYYEDFSSFDGLEVGIMKDNAMIDMLEYYAEKHSFSYIQKIYTTETRLMLALQLGEIDAICSENLANHSELSLLGRIGADAYYFMSYKDNDFLHEINKALQIIKTDSNFETNLYHKYYNDSVAETSFQFSKREREYLKSAPVLKIGILPDFFPLSSYNKKTNTFEGVNVEYLKKLFSNCGLKYEFVPIGIGEKPVEALQKEECDIAAGIVYDNFIDNSNFLLSDIMHIDNLTFVARKNHSFTPRGQQVVSVHSSFQYLQKLIASEYPNYKVILEETTEDSLKAVQSGKADLSIQNTYVLSYYLQNPRFNGLVSIPIPFAACNIAMASIASKQDPILFSIINKGINFMPDAFIEKELSTYTLSKPYKLTFIDVIYKFWSSFLFGILFIFLIFTLLATIAWMKQRNLYVINKKNDELRKAINFADQANNSKSQFLARMSHEIRTPMNAIVGITELAKHHVDEPNKISDYLSKIDSSSKVLLGIINDVLDMSSIENNKLKIAKNPFDMKELLNSLSSMYYIQCKNKGIKFILDATALSHEILIGDSLRVNQICFNLLSNAFKFTPEGGEIKVVVTEKLFPPSNIFLNFTFTDTGCGMSKDLLSRIFRPFEQEDATTAQKHGGSGLGLSIAKMLVDMMQGQLSVESELGKGTTFSLELPFEILESQTTVYDESMQNLRVLVVDDDADTCEYTTSVLQRIGVQYKTAKSGEDAIKLLKDEFNQNRKFDVCFVDWKGPNTTALDITKKIRELFDKNTIIIIVSSYDLPEIHDEAKVAGVNYFISKPLFQSTVFNTLMLITAGKCGKTVAESTQYDFTGKKVLLVEDKQLNREIAEEFLKLVNFEIDTACDGEEAYEKFISSPENQYDAILMDIQMPILNGLESTQKIRKSNHKRAKTIPIIAMTANAFTDDVTASLAVGMNGHIAKPIDTKLLYKTLNDTIKEENILGKRNGQEKTD